MKNDRKVSKEILYVVIVTFVFFMIFNIAFQLKYEEIDDFLIMNIISKADGQYSIYGIYLHPVLCILIVMLFKTGINVNWYSIMILTMQFVSFVVIGTILIKKHKSNGKILYILLLTLYLELLGNIQYTSTAMLISSAGILSIIYSRSKENVSLKYFILGNILIIFGAMLRFYSCIAVIPLLILFYVMKNIQDKNKATIKSSIKDILIIAIILLSIFASNKIIYNINPIYKNYLEFNNLRSYLQDIKRLDYEKYEDELKQKGWSQNDIKTFYNYFYADENMYNTENLKQLVEIANINNDSNILEKLESTFKELLLEITSKNIIIPFTLITILAIVGTYKNNKYTYLIFLIFIITIAMHISIIYVERPVLRVILPIYIAGISLTMYFLPELNINKIGVKVAVCIVLLFVFCNLYKEKINIKLFDAQKETIEYVQLHKENVYFHSTISLCNRNFIYSVYEKIPDNTFSNLAPIAEWTIYTENYYKLKERYNLQNIIEDFYKKDNVYIILDKKRSQVHLSIIENYIKEHYNVDIKWNLIKEFKNTIQIYKIEET